MPKIQLRHAGLAARSLQTAGIAECDGYYRRLQGMERCWTAREDEAVFFCVSSILNLMLVNIPVIPRANFRNCFPQYI